MTEYLWHDYYPYVPDDPAVRLIFVRFQSTTPCPDIDAVLCHMRSVEVNPDRESDFRVSAKRRLVGIAHELSVDKYTNFQDVLGWNRIIRLASKCKAAGLVDVGSVGYDEEEWGRESWESDSGSGTDGMEEDDDGHEDAGGADAGTRPCSSERA